MPARRVETDVFTEIVVQLRRWADAMERHVKSVGTRDQGPDWASEDLTRLYQAWLRVGEAIRDVARSDPKAAGAEARSPVLALHEGLTRIGDILERAGSGGAGSAS